MNCSNCGSSLAGSESVCPYCGKPTGFNSNTQINNTNDVNIGGGGIPTPHPVTQTQNQNTEQASSQKIQQPLTQNNNQNMNNKKSNNKNTLLIIAVVVIIALLAMCAYLLLSRNNSVAGVNNNVNKQSQNNSTEDNTETNKDNEDDSEKDNSTTKITCIRQNNVLDAKYELGFVNDKLENFALIYTLKNIEESIMTEAEAKDFLAYAFMYLDLTEYKDDEGVIFSADESDTQIAVNFKVEVSKASEALKSDLLANYENKSIEDIKTQITNDGFVCE